MRNSTVRSAACTAVLLASFACTPSEPAGTAAMPAASGSGATSADGSSAAQAAPQEQAATAAPTAQEPRAQAATQQAVDEPARGAPTLVADPDAGSRGRPIPGTGATDNLARNPPPAPLEPGVHTRTATPPQGEPPGDPAAEPEGLAVAPVDWPPRTPTHLLMGSTWIQRGETHPIRMVSFAETLAHVEGIDGTEMAFVADYSQMHPGCMGYAPCAVLFNGTGLLFLYLRATSETEIALVDCFRWSTVAAAEPPVTRDTVVVDGSEIVFDRGDVGCVDHHNATFQIVPPTPTEGLQAPPQQ